MEALIREINLKLDHHLQQFDDHLKEEKEDMKSRRETRDQVNKLFYMVKGNGVKGLIDRVEDNEKAIFKFYKLYWMIAGVGVVLSFVGIGGVFSIIRLAGKI